MAVGVSVSQGGPPPPLLRLHDQREVTILPYLPPPLLRLHDQREVTLQESCPITSISLSADSSHLLVALAPHTVRLWHLGQLSDPYPQALHVGPDPMDRVRRGGGGAAGPG